MVGRIVGIDWGCISGSNSYTNQILEALIEVRAIFREPVLLDVKGREQLESRDNFQGISKIVGMTASSDS